MTSWLSKRPYDWYLELDGMKFQFNELGMTRAEYHVQRFNVYGASPVSQPWSSLFPSPSYSSPPSPLPRNYVVNIKLIEGLFSLSTLPLQCGLFFETRGNYIWEHVRKLKNTSSVPTNLAPCRIGDFPKRWKLYVIEVVCSIPNNLIAKS